MLLFSDNPHYSVTCASSEIEVFKETEKILHTHSYGYWFLPLVKVGTKKIPVTLCIVRTIKIRRAVFSTIASSEVFYSSISSGRASNETERTLHSAFK